MSLLFKVFKPKVLCYCLPYGMVVLGPDPESVVPPTRGKEPEGGVGVQPRDGVGVAVFWLGSVAG